MCCGRPPTAAELCGATAEVGGLRLWAHLRHKRKPWIRTFGCGWKMMKARFSSFLVKFCACFEVYNVYIGFDLYYIQALQLFWERGFGRQRLCFSDLLFWSCILRMVWSSQGDGSKLAGSLGSCEFPHEVTMAYRMFDRRCISWLEVMQTARTYNAI